MGLYDYTIYSIIKRNSSVHGDCVGWIGGEQRITHREFLKRVDQLSRGLLDIGLERGDHIAVLAENSLEFILLYGAVAKIGAVIIPINWRLKPEEIEYIITDGIPKVIFVGPEFQSVLSPLISKSGFIENCYAIGHGREEFKAFDSLMENEGVCSEMDVRADDAYVILYTSAVEGNPRGAILSHRNLIVSNLQSMHYFSLTEKDCTLNIVPLFHLGGIASFLSIMQSGGLNIILPKFDVGLALGHIQKDKVTIFCSFPPILANLLDKAREDKFDLSSLRVVFGLDQLETVKRFEELTGATFWTVYGQSEIAGFVSYAPYLDRIGSAGVRSLMAEVEIMDDHGNIVETGKAGEIVVRGPMVFKGYWNLKKENQFTFRDGWHHTGDIGRFDADGFLWYAGRKAEKELIKPGGENVYPAEVEKAILAHRMVEEVAVIGVPDKQWGEAIKAICVLKKGESLTESELREFVTDRIARFKKPKYVVFVSKLPRTQDGLIDREMIKEDYGGVNNDFS